MGKYAINGCQNRPVDKMQLFDITAGGFFDSDCIRVGRIQWVTGLVKYIRSMRCNNMDKYEFWSLDRGHFG